MNIEKLKKDKRFKKIIRLLPLLLIIIYFLLFSTLSVVRHSNYQSFGFDLGINDQTVWRYSELELPLTTIDPFPDKTKLAAHVELVYLLIAPSYWIWDSSETLLILEVGFIAISGYAIYLLARKRKITESVSIALVITYLGFYGIQNALWFDAHSITFGAALIAWFLYFFDIKKYNLALIFLILAITAKENIAFITFLISFYYLIKSENKKWPLIFMSLSVIYILFVFYIFFPHIVQTEYLYENNAGLLSNFNPLDLINTSEKLKTIFYSFFSFGFLPFLSPLALIPIFGDFAIYFVIGSELPGAQGIFGHYRVMLAPLLVWSTIITISRFKKLNNFYVAIYLVVVIAIMQYHLHLPLSFLSKSWFWTEPIAVKDINYLIDNLLPDEASVVAQNNITPHISHRNEIFTLYFDRKNFLVDSPCEELNCEWMRWFGNPEYLIVDLSSNWDARHLLANNEEFRLGIKNLEKAGVIEEYESIGDAKLYKVIVNPSDLN